MDIVYYFLSFGSGLVAPRIIRVVVKLFKILYGLHILIELYRAFPKLFVALIVIVASLIGGSILHTIL
jgi:hypothetical protein